MNAVGFIVQMDLSIWRKFFLCAFDKIWYPSGSRNIFHFLASNKDTCMRKPSGSESHNSSVRDVGRATSRVVV